MKPYTFITVEDNNTNVQRIVVGPKTYTTQSNETVVQGPFKMIVIPPGQYCEVRNPVVRGDDGAPAQDEHGVYVCNWGEYEIRLAEDFRDPFPLYPGEELSGSVTPLRVVQDGMALELRAERDFTDAAGTERSVGERWLVEGPMTYIPRIEVSVVSEHASHVILETQALRVRAKEDFVDVNGEERLAGSEWLIRTPGRYLCKVTEEKVRLQELEVLTETRALHLRAMHAFTDVYGVERKSGDEWLVTLENAPTHMLDIYEELVRPVTAITLSNTDYCVIEDPVDAESGMNALGVRNMVRGPRTFFLQPGERLPAGRQSAHLLSKQSAIVLKCVEAYTDDEGTERAPGDRWMVHGPCEYYPPPQVQVVAPRSLIPLDKNEGVYVRDLRSGKVRAEIGKSYMLEAYEELWEKELSPDVAALLAGASPFQDPEMPIPGGTNSFFASASASAGVQSTLASAGARAASLTAPGSRAEKWRVVTYRVPHNAAVQIFDFKTKESRVVLGPELVLLQPDESMTVFSLSGGRPKRPNAIKSALLYLGPDFMFDTIVVETSDHARLSLHLGYNWEFRVESAEDSDEALNKIFAVSDFIGDACKALGSSIRGTVASIAFQEFHANSARIIRAAVFGLDTETGKVNDERVFAANGLVITNVDIQNVDPVDQRTRDSLQKSVSLAIEITTDALEAKARNVAKKEEQQALGELEQLRIRDSCQSEAAKIELLKLQADCESIKTTGKAKAEAKAQATMTLIEAESEMEQSQLRADAADVEAEFELKRLKSHYGAELNHQMAINNLELEKSRQLTEIEITKFKAMVEAITPEVIQEIARAGPEMQAKLLGSLGLSSVLLTDGNSPVNLFKTAEGLVGTAASVAQQ